MQSSDVLKFLSTVMQNPQLKEIEEHAKQLQRLASEVAAVSDGNEAS